ncbi:MAG: hypothetical protein HQK65_07810 [Desulfamplus sp.]|nr:hypothetical protein [Desulfamplus sp.]
MYRDQQHHKWLDRQLKEQFPDDIVVRYLIKPRNNIVITEIVNDFIHEFSGSSWTDLPAEYLNKIHQRENYLYDLTINEYSNHAYMSIAFPHQNFDINLGGIAQLLGIIAGDNISSKKLEMIRITDIVFPKLILQQFPGPSHGIDGIREIYKIDTYPILQMILKPRLGLTAQDYAKISYQAAIAGVDAIRDDQMLVSTSYCSFQKKIEAISQIIKKAQDKTGRPILYYPNITMSQKNIKRVIDDLREKEIRALTINAIFSGFGSIEYLRDIASDFIIQAHRSGYVLLSNNVRFSISYSVLAQLLHLSGADEIHIGSIFGRFDVKKQEALNSLKYITKSAEDKKTSFPIISGSVTPAIIEATVNEIGHDIIFMAGSGIIGHPLDIEAGVKSIKEMIDIVMDGTRIESHLSNQKTSKELMHAIYLWGYKRDGITPNDDIQKLAFQILQGKEVLDNDYKHKTEAALDYYEKLFDDQEISIIKQALNLTAKTVSINVGQVTEKYVRRICLYNGIEYRQLFSAIEKLFESNLLENDLIVHLHGIRILYNKAKHKNIFISFTEAIPALNALISFFNWLDSTYKKAICGG